MEKRTNINNLIQPLLTDKYQMSMFYAYWYDSKHEKPAVFDLYFRKNPFKGEYTIFAGLDECLKYLSNFRFKTEDIEYLKKIPDYEHIDPRFWDYLATLDAKDVKLFALNEGSVCFPNLPLVRAEGPLGILQLIETTLLNLINYASLVATNAARYKVAVQSGPMPKCKLIEFGLRRAQGPDGGLSASRYSYIGGFDATSNLLAGKEFNIPVSGTIGHAFIMSYTETSEKKDRFLLNKLTGQNENFTQCCIKAKQELSSKISMVGSHTINMNCNNSEFEAFIAFACSFPNTFLVLVDTYDVLMSGLINFCIVAIALLKFGYTPKGIRIDSGDLAYLSKVAKDFFCNVASVYNLDQFKDFEIVASNDINEMTIYSLNDQNHSITCMGIGTHLVTCQSQPALGCVYKLVEIEGKPCMKLSSIPEKTTIPCKKAAYRLFGKDGNAILDLIIKSGDPVPKPGEKIMCRHPFIAEKRTYVTPSRVEPLLNLCWNNQLLDRQPDLNGIRGHCIQSLSHLTDDIKRSLNPTPYKVSVSENLFALLTELKIQLTPIGELC